MIASLVIRTRNEAPRLRLTLASLECQQHFSEILVVDDGSIDETAAVLREARKHLSFVILRNGEAQGRAAASNRGAGTAQGDVLIFLDGDTLAGPNMVSAHLSTHAVEERVIGRGETRHLRCTRFLHDPETARFQAVHAGREASMTKAEKDALKVTVEQVRSDFHSIEARSASGVYPGAAPARLNELELQALATSPASDRLWAAASGSNFSVRRRDFLGAGGFDPELDINEHRELAYRLFKTGLRMKAVPTARTYHLTHRSGWRDPLAEGNWERRFRARHPDAPISALKDYWLSISSACAAPDFFGLR